MSHQFTTQDIIKYFNVLTALDEGYTFTKDGKETKRRFEFGEKANYGMMRTLTRLTPIVTRSEADRKTMDLAFNPEGKANYTANPQPRLDPATLKPLPLGPMLTQEKQKLWDEAHEKWLKEPVKDFEPYTFKLSSLQLDKNPELKLSLVAGILDVIVEDDVDLTAGPKEK